MTQFFRYLVNKNLRRRPFSGIIMNSGIQVSGILVGIVLNYFSFLFLTFYFKVKVTPGVGESVICSYAKSGSNSFAESGFSSLHI